MKFKFRLGYTLDLDVRITSLHYIAKAYHHTFITF